MLYFFFQFDFTFFSTSCYSSLLVSCVSQAVWVTNDKTKTCRGLGRCCDVDKDLGCFSFFFFFCSVLAFYTGCNQLQLANWLTNLAYCTSFVLLFAFAGLESVWWLATNCTLIDSSSFDSFSLSLAHISMVSMLPPQKEADRQSLHSTANDFGSSAGPR